MHSSEWTGVKIRKPAVYYFRVRVRVRVRLGLG